MAIKHTAVSYYGLNYVEHAERALIKRLPPQDAALRFRFLPR